MVRHTDEADDESNPNLPPYAAVCDLADVTEGDRVEFTTNASLRKNGVSLTTPRSLTVDDVTVEEVTDTEMVEVDPAWFPDTGPFGSSDDVVSKTVPRDVTRTKKTVVCIGNAEDAYRYTLRQTDDGAVRVGSCKQADYVDQNERGEFNAVARSNVSHGWVTSWSHDPANDTGTPVDDDPFDSEERVDQIDDREPRTDGGKDDPHAAAREVEVGDTVEVEASPLAKDGTGTVTGEVVYANIRTVGDDETGSLVRFRGDDGNTYERTGAGQLTVASGDDFHAVIATDSTLRRVATDGGHDTEVVTTYLIAGKYTTTDPDEAESYARRGEYVTAVSKKRRVCTDGGTPECEACDRDELKPTDAGGDFAEFVCEWCGAFVDADGRLPRADDKRCPTCHGQVAYGILSDPAEGIRGWLCVGDCTEYRIVRPEDATPVATDGGRDVHVAPNYDIGGVWLRLGDRERKLLSPGDARSLADTIEDRFGGDFPGYDTEDFVDSLRDIADDVEPHAEDTPEWKYDAMGKI